MRGYKTNIEDDTTENEDFRRVLYTAPHSQLVLMSLLPSEEIGEEVHGRNDQFFRIEYGNGMAVLNGEEVPFKAGDCVVVPSGTKHNIINTSKVNKLKLYTIYSPAKHPDGLVIKKKHENKDGDMVRTRFYDRRPIGFSKP